jgi:ketosteroid isomerase-like protein
VFEQRVEFLRSAYDIWNRGDMEAWIALHDPSAQYDLAGAPLYDLDTVYRGHDGLRALWEGTHEPFGTFLYEPLQFTEGSDGVLVWVILRVRGAGSGVPVQVRGFHAWRFRGGLLWNFEAHTEERDARRAVGLGEPATGHYPRPDPAERGRG